MEKRNPTIHRMTRRAAAHDYTRPGVYHITLHVADSLGQPFGAVVGDLSAPDGSANAPHVALSPVGQVVEHELLTAIHERYPMIHVQDYVVMPDHLHFLVEVTGIIISRNGKTMPLGQVIAGFKKGCNKRYWEMTAMTAGGQGEVMAGGQTAAHTVPSGFPAGNAAPLASPLAAPLAASAPSGSVPGSFPAGYKVPSNSTTGRPPLFDAGYCDVMPIDAAQLATQRAYILNNPRSRLLRTSNRAQLMPRRGGIDTAVSPSAMCGFLRRECTATQFTPAIWQELQARFIIESGHICCDSYGNRELLKRHLLPVVCHRKDTTLFTQQKTRSLEAAAAGAVLVSARIARGEQDIMVAASAAGYPVIRIIDNGFSDRYHPSEEMIDACANSHLLLMSPWRYQFRRKDEAIHVPFCKAMNCVAQALCRTKDDWWKHQEAPDATHAG